MDVDGTHPVWMRSRDARAALHVSGKTLCKWASAGTIPSLILPGRGDRRHRLYDVSSVGPGSRLQR